MARRATPASHAPDDQTALKCVYTALVDANFWQSTLQNFTIAGAIYTFIIQRFESDETTTLSMSDLG